MGHGNSLLRSPRLLIVAAAIGILVAACGGGTRTRAKRTASPTTSTKSVATHAAKPPHPRPAAPSYPRVIRSALSSGGAGFVPLVKWKGQTAVSVAHSPAGVIFLSFNQRLVSLHLHSGTVDAGAVGWRFGPTINTSELSRVVAAFNGGFRFSTGAGGFESHGRVGVPLRAGLGSIVTYANGTTAIGSWRRGVPAPGQAVSSVRQNLSLFIDHGRAASSVGCVQCWGATLGGVPDPARAALGIASNGNLVWAGGEHLTPAALADAMVAKNVVRAVELDINPEWVAGYVYAHHGPHSHPVAVPVVPGQVGIPGEFLIPWSRDFFSVVVK